ncbi:hypothetical protein Rhow_006709 [Rhodococcus wratislaviensis]|uniref:Uncharacterized protein n=1 Tax=Rhodococcus wratislaviensis TaxID=44752 RepID=A0A402CG59_RHOWR|nr:hypothetical protein Rhow_006709 [Rhodococcus wratislaviensis]
MGGSTRCRGDLEEPEENVIAAFEAAAATTARCVELEPPAADRHRSSVRQWIGGGSCVAVLIQYPGTVR